MERIKRLKQKAERRQEINELEIARLEQAQKDKELEIESERIAEKKFQAQKLHESDLKERQRQRDLKNEASTPEARTREAYRQAKEIKDRDISRGLTKEERAYKYMDVKERRRCDNAIKQGDAKDIIDFQRQQRLQQEESDRRRRKLKGL